MIVIKITLFIAFININLSENSCAQSNFSQTGTASYYASKFHGRKTASGEKYDMKALTAAHNTIPFNTYVKVTNLSNKKSVVVKINDRGPFAKNRIIDLSTAAAKKIDLLECGVAKVKLEVVNSPEKEESVTNSKSKDSDQSDKNKHNFQKGKIYSLSEKEVTLKGYGIQLGSFSDEKKLYKEIEKIKSDIKNIYIEVSEVKSRKVFRIISGSFPDKESAQSELKKIKGAGHKGFVKKFN